MCSMVGHEMAMRGITQPVLTAPEVVLTVIALSAVEMMFPPRYTLRLPSMTIPPLLGMSWSPQMLQLLTATVSLCTMCTAQCTASYSSTPSRVA